MCWIPVFKSLGLVGLGAMLASAVVGPRVVAAPRTRDDVKGSTIEQLVKDLESDDEGVRWTASEHLPERIAKIRGNLQRIAQYRSNSDSPTAKEALAAARIANFTSPGGEASDMVLRVTQRHRDFVGSSSRFRSYPFARSLSHHGLNAIPPIISRLRLSDPKGFSDQSMECYAFIIVQNMKQGFGSAEEAPAILRRANQGAPRPENLDRLIKKIEEQLRQEQ